MISSKMPLWQTRLQDKWLSVGLHSITSVPVKLWYFNPALCMVVRFTHSSTLGTFRQFPDVFFAVSFFFPLLFFFSSSTFIYLFGRNFLCFGWNNWTILTDGIILIHVIISQHMHLKNAGQCTGFPKNICALLLDFGHLCRKFCHWLVSQQSSHLISDQRHSSQAIKTEYELVKTKKNATFARISGWNTSVNTDICSKLI